MSTKEELFTLLEQNKGRYISGEEIAKELKVSRTAVWKAVKALKSEGLSIEAVSNRGYCLSENTDMLTGQGVKKYLSPEYAVLTGEVLSEVTGSTNDLVKERAQQNAPEGFFIIAGAQSAGKGRAGRAFFSPRDTGIYLSLLLRPQGCTAEKAVRITTMAAVAACEAIELVSGKKALIKWVNDIFIDGKKVSGILTEASFNLENGYLDYAVMGIGFNVYEPEGGFPAEIKDTAGCIFNERGGGNKNRLSAEFLNRFMEYYNEEFGVIPADKGEAYTDKYRDRSLVIGKSINVIFPDRTERATALDVDKDCHLLVRFEDGKEELLSTGEISVRL